MSNSYVLYFEDKNPVIGLKNGEKKDKTIVQFKNGKIKQINTGKILSQFQLNENSIDVVSELIFSKAKSADLLTLYELLETNQEYSIDDLSSLLFDEISGLNNAATYIALKQDNLYFKEKNRNFITSKKEEIEMKLKQIELKQKNIEEKSRLKNLAIEWLADNYNDLPKNIPDFVYNYIEPLKNYTIYGENYKYIEEAKKILKILKTSISDSDIKTDWNSAFDICNKIGIFSFHENLAIHRFNIISGFKENEFNEAKIISQKSFDPDRVDLTGLETYSIDDETTKDIDDAFSLVEDENGYTLYVHIADASQFIDINSSLDKRASNLGMSVYLPSGKISMFPSILSEDKMSLISGENRAALTFITKFDKDYNIKEKQILKSLIRVKENVSYIEADKRIDSDSYIKFKTLYTISNILRKKRFEKGAIEFLNPDYKVIVIDENITIKKIEANMRSAQIIKELMVLTGYQAASFCLVNSIPCVYISQDEPLELIDSDTNLIDSIVEIFNSIRKLNKASLMTTPFRHYALGLDCYTQCTSPIRRYHDLIIQRQIKAYLSGEPIPYSREEIQKLSATSEEFRQNLSIAEKEEKTYWILHYLEKNINTPLSATILSQNRYDYKIFLDDYGLQNKITVNSKLYVGDQVKVKIKNINPRSGFLSLVYEQVKRK